MTDKDEIWIDYVSPDVNVSRAMNYFAQAYNHWKTNPDHIVIWWRYRERWVCESCPSGFPNHVRVRSIDQGTDVGQLGPGSDTWKHGTIRRIGQHHWDVVENISSRSE